MLSENISLNHLKDIIEADWDDYVDYQSYEAVAHKFRKTLTSLQIHNNLPITADMDAPKTLEDYTSLETLCIDRGIYFSLEAVCNMINSCKGLKNLLLGVFMVYTDSDQFQIESNTTVRKIQGFSDILITKAFVDFLNNFESLHELDLEVVSISSNMEEEIWPKLISVCLRLPVCKIRLNVELNNHIYLKICAEEASKLARKKRRRLFLLLDQDCDENLKITADEERLDLTLELCEVNNIDELVGSLNDFEAYEIAIGQQKAAVNFAKQHFYERNMNHVQHQSNWQILDSLIWHIDVKKERTKTLKLTEMLFCEKPEESNPRTDKLDHLIFSASIFHTDMLPWISYRILNLRTLTLQACHFYNYLEQKDILELCFSETKVEHMIIYLRRSLTNFYTSYKSFESYPTFDYDDELENATPNVNRRFDELPLMKALAQEKYCLKIKSGTKIYQSYRDRNGKIDSEAKPSPADSSFTLSIICKNLQRLTILNGLKDCVLDIREDEF